MMNQKARHQRIEDLKQVAAPLMDRLTKHTLYNRIKSHEDVCTFMEHHIFAVWDFMSLLKQLQRGLTCIEVPWVPQGNKQARRLINQIVLEEESDELGDGFSSHFEIYREAMSQVGANLEAVDRFLDLIRAGMSVDEALEVSEAPVAAGRFVEKTMGFVNSGSIVQVATAFTFGREEAIPGMFLALVIDLDRQFPGQYDMLHYYLDRHIELDGDVHSHLAEEMLMELCEDDDAKWAEAETALVAAIEARLDMWDGIVAALETKSSKKVVAA
jgi:hypothetical protein